MTVKRLIDAAYQRASALLPAGWIIGVVQWGDDREGPGVEHPWYVVAQPIHGLRLSEAVLGSGLDPVAALDDLTRLALRMSEASGN